MDKTPAAPSPAVLARPRRDRQPRYPPQATPRPRYCSSASAAAATDGYKPREEKSWEDFHPDLQLDAELPLFTADEVDGRVEPGARAGAVNGERLECEDGDGREASDDADASQATPARRRAGRPPRLLTGLGSPPAPRIVPLPTQNPKERLNLAKPSFRRVNHFLQYEENQQENKVNYVDRAMAQLGYQETDRWELPPVLMRYSEGTQAEDEAEVSLRLKSDGPVETGPSQPVLGRVEYDMDEQDVQWLEEINRQRAASEAEPVRPAVFEALMTQIEKEYHALERRIPKPQPRHAQMHRPRSSSQAAVNGDPAADEPDSKCAVCDDGDCENANAIIFCDGCDLAVHQECYGVPFIPEGQWFCRRCREVGRGVPTCLFCPSVDGAFKQTTTMRWSHVLCALWIPEVSIANMTFMEPIADVEMVPRGRWALVCYICNQRMGACIQCGYKNCYQAFHVTCARRARLFLNMKSPNQSGIDTANLRALCDKHVPPEWRTLHDTSNALADARRWCRHTFKDRQWVTSQTAAQTLGAPPLPDGTLPMEPLGGDASPSAKRRRTQLPKMTWRLPSGAPVVPAVVFNTVDASIARFNIRKRKEFVERVCRYWTLKRESRKGAPLLKRLQLQLEGFSTMEVTRRNFVGMGSAGRQRLTRRIAFSEMLQDDMVHIVKMADLVKEREALRLREVELLRHQLDTLYFPIPALLDPIIDRAQKIDEKTAIFRSGLERVALRVRERYYTSINQFSQDLAKEIQAVASPTAEQMDDSYPNIDSLHQYLQEDVPGSAEHNALTHEQKEVKKLAKRLVKSVKDMLDDAKVKEMELRRVEHNEELQKLDSLPIFTRAAARNLSAGSARAGAPAIAGAEIEADGDTIMNGDTSGSNRTPDPGQDLFARGGVPWYLELFDPEGTTIHEERYTGREVLRDMSEELTDMDEQTLTELNPEQPEESPGEPVKQGKAREKKKKTRKRKR
ncbi:hypothetical protein K470DRAFT_259726 [Piedraia hortae CBS 480.64]|uniref:Uncharacterized protein n=1 Tax=Piedraia hortae CBS 480.64 TaxID=1314780 RepID=A0A6A7BU94_9PEZI|nr:hypothetical protein K470DRAFT_259726 [Piedraia hortae CBS 480.64]